MYSHLFYPLSVSLTLHASLHRIESCLCNKIYYEWTCSMNLILFLFASIVVCILYSYNPLYFFIVFIGVDKCGAIHIYYAFDGTKNRDEVNNNITKSTTRKQYSTLACIWNNVDTYNNNNNVEQKKMRAFVKVNVRNALIVYTYAHRSTTDAGIIFEVWFFCLEMLKERSMEGIE